MIKVSGVLLIAVVLMAACAKPSVLFSSEKMLDKGYDAYKTYAFLPTTDTQYAKLINRQVLIPALVKEAIAVLEKKGLVLDTAKPDCLFTYHLVMNRKYDVSQQQYTGYNAQTYNPATVPMYNTSSSAISVNSYQRTGTGPYSDVAHFSSDNKPYTYAGNVQIDTLREGSMVIDMIDTKTRKVIWRSVAAGTRYESEKLSPEKAAAVFIPEMLKKLPRK
jgi:Domain of unknown function (DUF4136)